MNSASGEDGAAVPQQGIFAAIRPYTEPAPLAALFLGISSGFPFAMIGATLSSWLSDFKIDLKTVMSFTLIILIYNLKFLWAWMVESVRLPLLHRMGQRVSWMIFAGLLAMTAVINLGFADPLDTQQIFVRAILVAVAGATYDIVIDGYRIELMEPHQLGIGAGMSQYGWRIGSFAAASLALLLAEFVSWRAAYIVCSGFALSGVATALIMGEPKRHILVHERRKIGELARAAIGPFAEFFQRHGSWLILLFILLHKIGDTLANLTFRPLFKQLGFTKPEIAFYDVTMGTVALLIGVFIGGILYARLGLKRSVMISLLLMAISNLGFAVLAASGHDNIVMASVVGFENFASGIGGVCVVAYFSALCDLRFTAAQYALISAAASIIGRLFSGTTTAAMIEAIGYENFYVFTTLAALPGIILFRLMMRAGLIDQSIGSAGEYEGVAPAEAGAAAGGSAS